MTTVRKYYEADGGQGGYPTAAQKEARRIVEIMVVKQDFEMAIKEFIKPVVRDYSEGDTELELDGELEAINACYVLATKLAKQMAIGFQKHLNPESNICEFDYNEYRRIELQNHKK